MRRLISVLVCFSLCFLAFTCLSACNKASEGTAGAETTAGTTAEETTAAPQTEAKTATSAPESSAAPTQPVSTEHSKVKFIMESGESFVVELYPEYAPKTVENFLSLVDSGFYNGLTFHRIVAGFMAQGGSTDGLGMAGSETEIPGEFALNGFSQNTLSHTRGVISMARRGDDMNSASSQFFICYSADYTRVLDGRYAAFGKVTEGMDVIDSFAEAELEYNMSGEKAQPVTPIVIKTAEIIK